jgi:Zn-dependent protease with chaperone function
MTTSIFRSIIDRIRGAGHDLGESTTVSTDSMQALLRVQFESTLYLLSELGRSTRNSAMLTIALTDEYKAFKETTLQNLLLSMDEPTARSEINIAEQQWRHLRTLAVHPADFIAVEPAQFWVNQLSQIRIRVAARKRGFGIPANVAISNAPSARINAFIYRDRQENSYGIILDDGIKTVANYLSKAFASINFTRDGMVKKQRLLKHSNNPDVIDEYCKLFSEQVEEVSTIISSYIYFGMPIPASGVRPLEDPTADRVALVVEDCMQMFIVGHEYAHLLLGHFDNAKTQAIQYPKKTVDELIMNYEQEYDADRLGAELTLDACSGICPDRVFASTALILVVSAIESVEHGLSLAIAGSPTAISTSTHPPIKIRKERIWACCMTDARKRPEVAGPTWSYMFEADLLCRAALKNIEHMLLLNYQRGKSVAPRWKEAFESAP